MGLLPVPDGSPSAAVFAATTAIATVALVAFCVALVLLSIFPSLSLGLLK